MPSVRDEGGSWAGPSFTKTDLCSTSSELPRHDSKSRPIKSRCSHHCSAGDSTLAYECIKISCIKNISHPKLVSMNLNLYGRLVSVLLGREGTVDLAKDGLGYIFPSCKKASHFLNTSFFMYQDKTAS